MNKVRIILVLLFALVAFVGLANTAIWFHGAVFITLIGPFFWAVNWWLDKARQ
jgi:hypothetical protein